MLSCCDWPCSQSACTPICSRQMVASLIPVLCLLVGWLVFSFFVCVVVVFVVVVVDVAVVFVWLLVLLLPSSSSSPSFSSLSSSLSSSSSVVCWGSFGCLFVLFLFVGVVVAGVADWDCGMQACRR
ncbi:unnamed protein product [Polarella glacialis]|uniref:Uncharacterized protein n=1 Tax=Polarella glacialis TaxID=89957 RepID=A0A813DG38_POLGL|nr:unnamed protein product [Polarella glacialis]